MSYLFIGGPADGQRIEVPDGAMYWKFVELLSPVSGEFAEDSPHSQGYPAREHIYKRTYLVFDGKDHVYYRHEHFDPARMVERLMAHYQAIPKIAGAPHPAEVNYVLKVIESCATMFGGANHTVNRVVAYWRRCAELVRPK